MSFQGGEPFLCLEEVVVTNGNDYEQQAEEAAARIEWCERKLSFERKRYRALKDLAATQRWLDGKSNPLLETNDSASGS